MFMLSFIQDINKKLQHNNKIHMVNMCAVYIMGLYFVREMWSIHCMSFFLMFVNKDNIVCSLTFILKLAEINLSLITGNCRDCEL